jgi:hypothetical protein
MLHAHSRLSHIEGPEKTTRWGGGGMNGSQSKFLVGTWPMSQNQANVPLSPNSATIAQL